MGMFLNTTAPFKAYQAMAATRFFVDKTLLIDELLSTLEADGQKYVCITRPRRFGKTVMANMVGAFSEKPLTAAACLTNWQFPSRLFIKNIRINVM